MMHTDKCPSCHAITVAARRFAPLLAALILVACGGASVTPTVPTSAPAITLTASATPSEPLTPVVTVLATPLISSSQLPGSPSSVAIVPSTPADTPVVVVATSGTSGATVTTVTMRPPVAPLAPQAPSMTAPTATANRITVMATVNARDDSGGLPPAMNGQVVTITASDGIRIRREPSTNAEVIAEVEGGNTLAVVEESVPGNDGSSRWVHVRYAGKDGYVRSDLVGPVHLPSATKPPAIATPGSMAITGTAPATASPIGRATATRSL